MEAKAKGSPKSASKAEKKEAAPPPKPDPISDPAPLAATEPEKPADGDSDQQGATESGGCGCEMLENLKPFLIGGAVVALGAVLVGAILVARKN